MNTGLSKKSRVLTIIALGSTLSWGIATADDSLSREKAKELIQQELNRYGAWNEMNIGLVEIPDHEREVLETMARLKAGGYITQEVLRDKNRWVTFLRRGAAYKIQVTDKMTPYITKQTNDKIIVKLGEKELLGVTGVTKRTSPSGEAVTVAEYEYKDTPNPLGIVWGGLA